MAYKIQPTSVFEFVEDKDIKLPRFQRKLTWKPRMNFELAISVFKDFPMGVTILNKEKTVENIDGKRSYREITWMLDGRQRRHALKQMRENPETLYAWAKDYIKFNTTCHPDELEEQFWPKIRRYLEREDSDSGEDSIDSSDEYDDEIETPTQDLESSNLKILLDNLLMIHPIKNGESAFTKTFNFDSVNLTYLTYNDQGKRCIDPVELRKFLVDFTSKIDDVNRIDLELFTQHIIDKHNIRDEKCVDTLKNDIKKKSKRIEEAIRTIDATERIFKASKIGVIEISDVSIVDAQNIFRIINTGGSKLTSEEILSAKPEWNDRMNAISTDLINEVDQLYKEMEIRPRQNDVVKWDFPATIYGRIDPKNILLKPLSYTKDAEYKKRITLGFKIVSSTLGDGTTSEDVSESVKKIDWENTEEYVGTLREISRSLYDYEYFHYLPSWNSSILDLTNESIMLNFIGIMYRDWNRKGSNKTKVFQKNGLILADRVVYEYITKKWKGSGDSRLADNLRKFNSEPELFLPIEQDAWKRVLDELATKDSINGDPVDLKTKKSLLIHINCIKGIKGGIGDTFDVDHIYPKKMFESSTVGDPNHILNLALFPSKLNNSKKDNRLKNLDGPIRAEVSQYTGIPLEEFDKYSSMDNYENLKNHRRPIIVDEFLSKRNSLLMN